MTADTTRCPKYNGAMAQGFIVDFHAGGKRLVSCVVRRSWGGPVRGPVPWAQAVPGRAHLVDFSTAW